MSADGLALGRNMRGSTHVLSTTLIEAQLPEQVHCIAHLQVRLGTHEGSNRLPVRAVLGDKLLQGVVLLRRTQTRRQLCGDNCTAHVTGLSLASRAAPTTNMHE